MGTEVEVKIETCCGYRRTMRAEANQNCKEGGTRVGRKQDKQKVDREGEKKINHHVGVKTD